MSLRYQLYPYFYALIGKVELGTELQLSRRAA